MEVVEQLEKFLNELKLKQKVENNTPMGLGKIGSVGIVFNRQYRFLISGEHLPKDYNKKVEVFISPNWGERRLILTSYDLSVEENGTMKNPAWDWAQDMLDKKYPDETLTLITLDGVGKQTSITKFENLRMLSVESVCDYDSSDAVHQKMTLSFGKYHRESAL